MPIIEFGPWELHSNNIYFLRSNKDNSNQIGFLRWMDIDPRAAPRFFGDHVNYLIYEFHEQLVKDDVENKIIMDNFIKKSKFINFK